jgi:hypothetical protein
VLGDKNIELMDWFRATKNGTKRYLLEDKENKFKKKKTRAIRQG